MSMMRRTRERPEMYFGDARVHSLYCFVTGYCWAREDLGLDGLVGSDAKLLSDFEAWLGDKTRLRNVEWVHHIQYIDDGPRSVDTFYRMFEQFVSEKDHKR